jgi:hypothetical protein
MLFCRFPLLAGFVCEPWRAILAPRQAGFAREREEEADMAPDQITVEAARIIEAPIERVWSQVANFNNVAAWHPDVTESQLEAVIGATNANAGEIRIIKLRNGTILRERLVEMNPAEHRYTYSVLDGQLPLKGHISTLRMRPVDARRTEVIWKAAFEPAGAPADALAEGVRSGVLELGLQGLADRVRGA